MPEAGAIHCESRRECVILGQPGPASKQELGYEEELRGIGWKVTRSEMEPKQGKQGWGQGWEVTNQADTARRGTRGPCRTLGPGEAEG